MEERVKRILNFKRPSRVISVAAVTLVAVLSVAFAVNRGAAPDNPPRITVNNKNMDISAKAGDLEIYWVMGMNKWNGNAYDREDNFKWIMSQTAVEFLQRGL